MATDDLDLGAISKSDPLQALYNQKLHFSGQKSSLENKVEENENKIKRIENELKEQTSSDDWLIDRFFTNENMNAEFKDKSFAERHAIEIAKEILCRMESNEDLMIESVKLNRHSYHCLNGMGRLSEELEIAFTSLLRKVEGKKSVNWKDNISSPKLSKRREVESLFSLPTYSSIPVTPLANTSRALVSIHDITPYSHSIHLTPEKSTPLTQKNFNLSKLSLNSTITKKSPIAIVAANKRTDHHINNEDDTENNPLNDTFTIGGHRTTPSPKPKPSNDYWKKSPNNTFRNNNNYNNYNNNTDRSDRSGYKSRSPYQSSNHYNNQWNRNSNYNLNYRNNGYNSQSNGYSNSKPNRQFQSRSNGPQSKYYPRFRF